jgi:hypothetical protein
MSVNFTPSEQESEIQLPLNLISKLVETIETNNKDLDEAVMSLNHLISLY